MGGKQKQAQRTKNNARPSNSGRSAELLGTSLPQFVSFSGLKETCFANVGFSLAPIEEFDSSVDSNFQLVLKKMNKKDSTTKLKALQEFTELVKNTESEALKAILPFWPRLYCVLSTDAEHRVREATHIAHHQVVTKAKRNLAPYLKQLAGPWFTSQYDTYPPASSAATLAFQDAFPANKLQDAIVFCQDEILNYIADNVTVHTAQTLSNPKTHSAEDSKAKYERVLIASLQGYALYLNKVPSDGVKKAEELNKKIISSAKFWKLARHEVGQVRAAWYSVLTALCQRASFLLDGEAGHVTKVVLGNLDENDPGVLSHVWEAALLTITTIENWWSYINVDELFLPKLWKVLRQAGQGNATVIYPNLLPLLSHLPTNLDIGNFYKNFFENMRSGITQKTISSSQSESRALSVTLIECLQYAILKNQSDINFCESLIDDHLLPTLSWSLEVGQAAYKTLFSQVSSLLQYWHRNRNHKDLTNYSQYFNQFWSKIPEIFKEQLAEENLVILSDLISREIEFLMCLKHTVKTKKQLKVKFSQDETRNSEQGEINVSQGLDKSYLDTLNGLVFKTGALYIDIVGKRRNSEVLEHVISLVQEFESKEFLQFLAGSEEIVKIYEGLVKGWMADEKLCSKAVVDLLFLTFKYLGNEDKREILNSFNQIDNEECLSWCIARCLSHPHHLDPEVQLWLHSDKVGEFLKKIIEYELRDECSADFSLLLKQAFTETIDGELLISKKSITEIISILNQCLLSPSRYPLSIDTCASFAAYISAIIYTEQLKLSHGDDLLLALFTLGSDKSVDPETLSKDTLWEVNTAWQDTITLIAPELSKNEFIDLTRKITKVIDIQLFSDLTKINEGDVVEKISSFISCVRKSNVYYVGEILKILFGNKIVGECKRFLEDFCCRGEFLKGHLSCAFSDFQTGSTADIVDESVAKYFVWKSVVASVLLRPIEEWNEDDEDFGNEDEGALVKLLDETEDVLGDLFYDLALLESVSNNCKMMRYFNKIEEVQEDFRAKLVAILSKIDPPTKTALQCHLQTNAIYKSWLWMKSFYIYTVEICEQPPSESYDLLQKFIKDEQAISRLHATQIFAPHLSYDNIHWKMNTVEAVVTLRHLLHCEDIDVQIAEVYGRIEVLRNEKLERLYNINFSSWENVQTATEILRLCESLISSRKLEGLSRKHWDFIVVSLGSWAAKLSEVKNICESIEISTFVCAIGQLFCTMQNYIDELAMDQPAHSYIDEWKNVFVQSITTDLVKTWLHLSTKYSTMTIQTSDVQFLQEFGKILPSINADYIFKSRSASMPKWSKLLTQSSALLTSSTHCLQLWGYHMLIVLSKGLIEVDSVSVDTNTPHEKGMIIEQFKELLVKTQEIVDVMLLDFKLGEDSCRVEPFTDSYTYTFAYLLIWDVLLNLCENSSRELRFQYADWLKKEDLLCSLLNNIFKLLPTEVLHCGDGKIKPYQEYFTKKIELSLDDSISSKKLECVVCWVYASILFQLPASVRQWWSNVEIRTSQIVERVTASYVSPQLCVQELTDVAEHETKFKNMIIKVHQSVRECVAVYTVDESQMELVITLPANYPLGGPDVQCNRQIGGTSHKQWLMQLKMCVLHQNGRIWDALSLWNNNLDKKFDGVEECYICFAVLHPGTYQLPKLSCKTCRKKFHAACLYKWFSTSNKSTCPICRNLF